MIKLITHTDLDGIGCAILAGMAFSERELDIIFADYNVIDEEVEKVIKEHHNYEKIIITDISFDSYCLLKEIEKDTELQKKLILLDHHQTAKHLEEYPWAIIKILPESGTSLFFKYLVANNYLKPTRALTEFVELVRQYDTWEWKEKGNIKAKELNMLLYIYGRDYFMETVKQNLANTLQYEFSDLDKKLLEIEYKKIRHYVEAKEERMSIVDFAGYRTAVIFAEQYIGDLTEYILNKYEDIDILMVIQPDKAISLRTRREDINLGEIAQYYGGGGHPKAAGITFEEEQIQMIYDYIVEEVLNV